MQGSQPLFRSGAASPADLLARVRRRLEIETAPTPTPFVPVDPEFDLATGEGLLEGWYRNEVHDDTTVRWVARRFAFEAEVRNATHVLLEAAVFPESGFAQLRLRTRANDVLGASVRLYPGWNQRLIPIPAGITGRVHFFVDCGGSWSAASDPRELAILVRRLSVVRFVQLPRSAAASVPSPVRSARPAPFAVRVARKLRRLLLGYELTEGLLALEESQRRLRTLEERLDAMAEILEDRLSQLAQVDAETATDAAEREEEWQEEVARKFLQFYRG